jgi:2,4-dienoyl-CoA reductase-like NADH-dependent reductase (Old Yellow Enzyme family)/thioredoxin reductase
MGRRQFLAAGMASTCALTCKRMMGFEASAEEHAATAAAAAPAAIQAAVGNRCPHLLSPLRIRDRVLKNRIVHSQSSNQTMQGPENYPTETFRNHYLNLAKNAAIVTMPTMFGSTPRKYVTKAEGLEDYLYEAVYSWQHIGMGKWDDIPPVWNYVERMINDIHTENSLVNCSTRPNTVVAGGSQGYFVGPGEVSGQNNIVGMQKAQQALAKMQGNSGTAAGFAAPSMAARSVAEIVKEAKEYEALGYDVYQPASLNQGGSQALNREVLQAIRNETNLIIFAYLSYAAFGTGKSQSYVGIRYPNQATDEELEKGVADVQKLEGLADIVFLRAGSEHPNSFCQDQEKPWSLAYAEAVKKAGLKIITCTGAGFHNPVQNDKFIAEGKTDMVGMNTPLFVEPDMVKKLAAGKADDVLQCYMCQDCHAISMVKGPHIAMCDLNPKWGTPAYKLASITPPLTKKKVAVVGGGPAGMKAAITAAERGHKVTLYEKADALGGLQRFSDYSQWRWNHKVFKDYLVHQVNKQGVEVKLKTAATPEMIKAAGFDAVLVATGAEIVPPATKGANVFDIMTCYSNKKALGENVVMIGAGKFGTEAAVGIVKDGHKITVLAPGDEMIDIEDCGPHNVGNQERIYKNHPNFKYFMNTKVTDITGGKVTYTDKDGAVQSIQADSIVFSSELKPNMDEAAKFIGSADQVLLVGDCTGTAGRIHKTIRNAYFVASEV